VKSWFLLVLAALALAVLGCVSPAPQTASEAPASTPRPRTGLEVTPLPASPTPRPIVTVVLPDRESCAEIRGTEYHSAKERDWYLANCIPTPTPTPVVPKPNPPAIPGADVPGERWVWVDLAHQTASAMIGDKVLYTALVTTGKDGWETPTGTFHILYRVANETMTSASIGAEEYYVLKDRPLHAVLHQRGPRPAPQLLAR
jgi:lipoprotein-anchoring transpeptidase ErfK/SrfK